MWLSFFFFNIIECALEDNQIILQAEISNASKNLILREYIKTRDPNASFGIEWLSDATSQYADYVHNVYTYTKLEFKDSNGVPRTRFVPLYQYIYPETITTDREIRDGRDVVRRVHQAVLREWRSDVEIYRCRATVAEFPEYQSYLKEIGKLRNKYRRLILNGTFRDTGRNLPIHLPITQFSQKRKN